MNPRRILRLLLLLLPLAAVAAPAQVPVTEYDGATGLGIALRRLGTTKRVLMIAAHPDDERTEVLTTLGLGQGAEAAYLSLTRGEGGQNVIGPELQEGLGLIRSEELLAARRIDGAGQFFSRAYDYGFSKSADEAFRHWPRDSVLTDVVAAIRYFRPDVVVAVFTGTPADGHGQHQASGILAREAFAAAGDASRFPELAAAGLEPFSPGKLYLGGWRASSAGGPTVELRPGRTDPLIGESYSKIAAESRSRHRSQGLGGAGGREGPQTITMRLIGGEPGPAGGGAFSGVDTTFSGRLAGATDAASRRARDLLAEYEATVARVARSFDPNTPGAVVPELSKALQTLASARAALGGRDDDLTARLESEQEEAEDALWRAASLSLQASADDATVVPGQSFTLELALHNGGTRAVEVRGLEPELPRGWRVEALGAAPATLAPGATATRRFRVTVPADAPVTEPYFLRAPRRGDLYVWPSGVHVGIPFEPAPVRAAARVAVEGAPVRAVRDATRGDGPAARTVRVVPAVSVLAEPRVSVVPLGRSDGPPSAFPVRLEVRGQAAGQAVARIDAAPGWKVDPESRDVRLAPGDTARLTLSVAPAAALGPGETTLSGSVRTADGATYRRGYELIDYPHIRARALYRPAEVRARAFEARLPAGLTVGYVAGTGDDAPQALRQLGARVTELSPADLAGGDLERFDAILLGIRAYEVRPDLVKANPRLLEYVNDGGTLVVQYYRFERAPEGLAPYPMTARLQDRVTDETAAVRLLDASHRALSWPNRITQADFDGWVQERGLYFPREIDPHFVPLLEMADPGEAPQKGALLVAPYGKGTYVYTGLSLFRQLPEGVPGAYRLLANLVSLGAER